MKILDRSEENENLYILYIERIFIYRMKILDRSEEKENVYISYIEENL